jgi:hypothetical protein
MSRKEQIRAEILTTSDEGSKLLLAFEKGKRDHATFAFEYQEWYTKSLAVVSILAPDRIDEFQSYYRPDPKRKMLGYGTFVIQDYLKGVKPGHPQLQDFDSAEQMIRCFFNQLTIFRAILSRMDSILSDITSGLYADLQDNEIEVARRLAKINLRASGALVGVIVEGHLQNVAASHGVTIAKKNPTIADLNEPLKAASVIDTPTWRRISFLADLRNLCSHKKDREPTEGDVDELIKGAEWVSKNVS